MQTNRIISGVAEVTSSSAAAERPRDDSCPSVVSFYSVIIKKYLERSLLLLLLGLHVYHCIQLNAAQLFSV